MNFFWPSQNTWTLIHTPLKFHEIFPVENLNCIKVGIEIAYHVNKFECDFRKYLYPSYFRVCILGKKAQKMQQCTCVRVIFYFSKECRKEYIPPFIYYIFTKSCNFFVMSFAYFSKVLTFYRRIIAKQYVEKKDISKKKINGLNLCLFTSKQAYACFWEHTDIYQSW